MNQGRNVREAPPRIRTLRSAKWLACDPRTLRLVAKELRGEANRYGANGDRATSAELNRYATRYRALAIELEAAPSTGETGKP